MWEDGGGWFVGGICVFRGLSSAGGTVVRSLFSMPLVTYIYVGTYVF